jgi:hypothetical protein
MNRQITNCRFNVYISNGSSNTVVSGFPTNVSLYSGSYSFSPYYYTGSAYDESLNGSLRSQLGGYRFEAVLIWDRLINTTPLLNLINNAYTNGTGEVVIDFFPDASNATVFEKVIVDSVAWQSSLEATVIRQPLSIKLIGKEVKPTIPSFYTI